MEAGSWGWRVFSLNCCLSWKSLFGEATSPVLHGEGGEGDSQGCVDANSCSHSPLPQPAAENSYSWSSPTTECLGCTVRTGYLWREVTGEHFTVILLRSCKYTEIYFLYSKTELEVVKKLYMISICIFFYFCHSETFLAAVIIHEVPKAAY